MSDLIDEFVTELLETGSTGSKDNTNYTPQMYKRTPGKWTCEYVPDKGYALCVDNPEDNSEGELHPSNGDMQLMSYSAEMYSLLWLYLQVTPEVNPIYRLVQNLMAKIYVEPDADLNIPEELILQVKELRKELNNL